MKINWEILVGAALIAASILFIERYEISAYGYGFMNGDNSDTDTAIYRLDRWTGRIESCHLVGSGFDDYQKMLEQNDGAVVATCRFQLPHPKSN